MHCQRINMKKIAVINGPNLNLLGVREKSIYGDTSFDSYFAGLKSRFENVELTYFQSNCEGSIIDEIHRVGFDVDGIVLNAGAYTHYSIAIADAISQMVQAINNDDFEHYVFSLYIYPLNDGAYSIQVESHDPMNDPKEMRDNMLGVVKIGYRYFMVQKMPNMEALQKSLFTKTKGKTKFIREFELVPYARRDTHTSILAELENGKLNIKELEICNINKLENPESEAPATE